jgi:GT2 family glycosyltransferase
MQNSQNVTIIIPTYTNFSGFFKLISKLKLGIYPVIVIDNQPDEEKKKICGDGKIIYLPQRTNIGFARAINLGIRQAETEWILILNDDVIIQGNKFIDQLVGFAEKNNYSAVSPILKDSRGNIENLGYRVLPIGRVELNFDKQNIIDQHSIDGLTAACLMMKKKDFKAVGGLDARFFAYLEDVDLFLRMKKKGYAFGIDTTIEVIHDKNTTSSGMGNFKQRQDLINWFLIIAKNWDKKILLRYFAFIFIERLRNLSGYIKATLKSKQL